jgi:hypothetical protein
MRTVIAIMVVVVMFCTQTHAQTPPQSPDSRRPSATEVFELQGKCAEVLDKMAERGKFVGKPVLSMQYASHYSGWRNRCYVETVTLKDFAVESSVASNFVEDVVADVQTHELLVAAHRNDDKSYGMDWQMDESLVTFDQAIAKIHRLMTEENERRICFEASDGYRHPFRG